ncbi:MAG: hypothetical protein MUF07_15825 [Steroidobacteraceae bacterium]|nr:hypothetical protein [Steroidobacteraceae bacterium]
MPDWNFDAAFTKALQERISASGRLSNATIEPLKVESIDSVRGRDRRAPIDTKKLLSLAKEQGFDTVIALLPELKSNTPEAAPGLSLVRRKLPGLDGVNACAAISARIFRVSDGKQIGYAGPDPCTYGGLQLAWHDDWASYSVDEQQAVLSALKQHAELVLGMALAPLGLRPVSPPWRYLPVGLARELADFVWCGHSNGSDGSPPVARL